MGLARGPLRRLYDRLTHSFVFASQTTYNGKRAEQAPGGEGLAAGGKGATGEVLLLDGTAAACWIGGFVCGKLQGNKIQLVSKVKVTTEPRVEGGEASASGGKYGASEYLIEEEEGLNDHNVVLKCAEIQTAISEADMSQILQLDFMYLSYFDVHLNCFEV
ncbi:hypothetical protein ZWY2020_041483 [Hordeum vulgare]|nr:hypothetical protein ZWY2020_041483 [Hordeum vulgare]